MSEKARYEESDLYKLRHSASHVMAQAVLEKFPEGKIAIGPPIEDGFYYDFDLPRPLTPEDLEEIEARMREIIADEHDFVYQEIDEEEARRVFADQDYKLELIDGILSAEMDEAARQGRPEGQPLDEAPKLSIYRSGSFVDLCRGPHVGNTREINPDAIKLLNVAGAYWRGDERGGTSETRCSSASTARPGRRANNWRSTSGDGKRRPGAIIANWGGSWICSASTRWVGLG